VKRVAQAVRPTLYIPGRHCCHCQSAYSLHVLRDRTGPAPFSSAAAGHEQAWVPDLHVHMFHTQARGGVLLQACRTCLQSINFS
jgi:hypothetical protein